ncbi:hypothetical protein FA95DRAFT_1494862 [Auriscalpium vulgare]|uniref:Uncharacterized protein n=1 Tax=Auriscalpium vulgare TaxID=40419 RepID=A0ACB8RQH2_9AGAM|nr:hypothetical protein FA95DRAFT_1494862 [Auriscalpium vulgare]
MDMGSEQDTSRLWALLTELMEQLAQHKQATARLHAAATSVKNQAIHSQTGFVLRRYVWSEGFEYEAELERMNAAMSAENLALQHDNKQLTALIRDYETTLESVMSQFRVRAHEVQERELTIIRDFEARIIARETVAQEQQLAASTTFSESLTHVSRLLRQTMRSLGGEDIDTPPPEEEDLGPWDELAASEWALERECELSRLEKENQMLRRLMGEPIEEVQGPGSAGGIGSEDGRVSALPLTSSRGEGATILGGPKGTVGPFGTYKKMRTGG